MVVSLVDDLSVSKEDMARESLEKLIVLYKHKPVMIDKVFFYLANVIPSTLLEYENKTIVRAERSTQLDKDCINFSDSFLNENAYFRCEGNGTFVEYDGVHVRDADEDDIQYHVLSAISACPLILARKHKTKAQVMRRIKNRDVSTITPEDETIYRVVSSLTPHFFLSEPSAKHFLIAVGQSLIGQRDNVYICAPVLRNLFQVLDDASSEILGLPSALSHFKKKYHAHDYSCLRFFMADFDREPANVRPSIKTHVLDYLVVAIHLARSWGSADQFVEETACVPLTEHVKFTQTRAHEDVITEFINYSIVPCTNARILESEAWFAFREFFSRKGLPVLLFQDEFHKLLKEKLDFTSRYYSGYTSPCLPLVRSFSEFWESNMVKEPNSTPLDVETVVVLYRRGDFKKKGWKTNLSFFSSLIKHLYPEVVLKNNALIGFKCLSWKKNEEIEMLRDFVCGSDKFPATVAELYDIYLKNERSPKMKRRDFHNNLLRMYPGRVTSSGMITPSMWSSASNLT
tara:strand:+ start:1651 stop:3195 length:1545 start_codon:yes stop_codon:yes gene_type:complete